MFVIHWCIRSYFVLRIYGKKKKILFWFQILKRCILMDLHLNPKKIKSTSIIVHGKRKSCECYIRLLLLLFSVKLDLRNRYNYLDDWIFRIADVCIVSCLIQPGRRMRGDFSRKAGPVRQEINACFNWTGRAKKKEDQKYCKSFRVYKSKTKFSNCGG